MDPPGLSYHYQVTVSGLDEEVPAQDSLFSPHRMKQRISLLACQTLESKFGETAVMSGALWQRFHGDNGIRRKRSELKAAVDAQTAQDDGVLTKVDGDRLKRLIGL